MVGLSDDLGKLDGFVEQVTRKVASYLGEVLEDQRDKLHENLMANNSMLFHLFTIIFSKGMVQEFVFVITHVLHTNLIISALNSGLFFGLLY